MDVKKKKRKEDGFIFKWKSGNYEYMTTTDQRMVLRHHFSDP